MKVVRINLKLLTLIVLSISLKSQANKKKVRVNVSKECDLDLMNSFKLVGMTHPSPTQKPRICPYIEQNCCTLMDELTITKFWNDYSKPKISQYIMFIVRVFKNIFNFQKYISHLHFDNINFLVPGAKWVSYKQRYCSFKKGIGSLYAFSIKKKWHKIKEQIKRQKKGKKHKKGHKKRSKRSKRDKSKKKNKPNRAKGKRELNEIMEEIQKSKKIFDIKKRDFEMLSEDRKNAIINMIYMSKKYADSVQKAGIRFHDFVSNRGRKLVKKITNFSQGFLEWQTSMMGEMAKKKSKLIKKEKQEKNQNPDRGLTDWTIPEFLGYKTFLPGGGQTKKLDVATIIKERIEEFIAIIAGKKKKEEYKKREVYKPQFPKPAWEKMDPHYKNLLKQGKMFIEDFPYLITKQKNFFRNFYSEMQYMAYDEIEAEKLVWESKMDSAEAPGGTGFADNLINLINQQKFLFAKMPFVPEVKRKYDEKDFPSFRSSRTVCSVSNKKFYKYFVMTNAVKYSFCKTIHDALAQSNNINFKLYLTTIRDQALHLAGIKKGLYCGICDASMHEYFDSEKNIVYYSQNFCRDILLNYQGYFKFFNILFVELADDLIQYTQCFDSNGDELVFPFMNSFTKIKWRIKYYKKCFQNLEEDSMFLHCAFICKHYNINGFSKMIEGDMDILYKLYLYLIQFFRKHNIPFDGHVQVDENYLKSLNSELYKPRRLEINPEKKTFESNVPVFKAINKVVKVEQMEVVFLEKDDGFNPFHYAQFANFEVDVTKFIYENFLKDADKPIDRSVIESYFDASSDDLHDFNSDIYKIVKFENETDEVKKNDYDPKSIIIGNTPEKPKVVEPNKDKEINIIFS